MSCPAYSVHLVTFTSLLKQEEYLEGLRTAGVGHHGLQNSETEARPTPHADPIPKVIFCHLCLPSFRLWAMKAMLPASSDLVHSI
jgi:hypothetical protein